MATWQHLRSSTANKRPTTSLADGRIAINTNSTSPGLFFKDSAGTGIVKVGPVHVGTTAPNSVPAAGGSTGNYLGEQWFDISVSPAQMKVWNGSTWVGVVADELPVSKLQDGAPRQLIQTDAAGTGVEWTSNVDVPGTLDVTSTATFDSIAQYPLGSAGAPAITFTGDNNTGIYSPGADQVAISTGGTGRLFVDASGRVGIGATSPQTPLHVSTANSEQGRFESTGASYINVKGSAGQNLLGVEPGAGWVGPIEPIALAFKTGNAERARIDSSGRLLVGTSSSPSAGLGQYALAVVQGYAGSTTGEGILSIARGKAATALVNTDTVGQIAFTDNAGNTFAKIVSFVDGTVSSTSDLPGALSFSTTADGASSPTERMRITQGGKVIVNDTAAVLDATFSVLAQSGNNAIALKSNASTVIAIANLWGNETSGNQIFTRFATDSNAERGTIDYNRSAGQVRYNVTSDRRLKSEIIDAPSAVNLVSAIQVRSYKWTETNYKVDYGFIAQELFEVAPDAVKQGDEGEEVTSTWAVDNAKLVPVLTKALQEALIKIESLEARLTAAGV